MRWLKSLAFITLMTVVASQNPNIIVRAPILRQPLIKLAVQPPIVSEPIAAAAVEEDAAVVAPAVAGSPILPLVNPQYWGQFGAQNFNPYNPYGFNPYWGGFRRAVPRQWNRPYWRPPVVVAASTVAPVADAEKANTDAEVVEVASQ